MGSSSAGGGIYIITATATISSNKIYSNTAFNGAGLGLRNSAAIIQSSSIMSNTAKDMYGDDLKIIGHCDVEPNKPNCPGFNVEQWVKDEFYG